MGFCKRTGKATLRLPGYGCSTASRCARSLKLDMEISHHAETQVDYAVGTFWYARPGATHNRPPQSAEAALPLATLPAVGQKRPSLKLSGAQECEALEIVARTPGIVAGTQDLRDLGDGWSGDAHLFVQAQKTGDFVEVVIPAKEPGARRIILHATRSSDYGRLRFAVNGKVVDVNFDGYAPQPIPTGPINLGVHEPKDGKFILRAEVAGANPAANGQRYFFGLDCVALQPPTPAATWLPPSEARFIQALRAGKESDHCYHGHQSDGRNLALARRDDERLAQSGVARSGHALQ